MERDERGAELSEDLSDLEQIGVRIERLALDPGSVKAPFVRLIRRVFLLVGWQPELESTELRELLQRLAGEVEEVDEDELQDQLDQARDELEKNVKRAERACVVNGGELPLAHTAWLQRVHRLLWRAERAVARFGEEPSYARIAGAVDPVMLQSPLTLAAAERDPDSRQDEQTEGSIEPSQARLVELQLAAIDHIIEAATEETGFIERRRRLLEAARRLLLDATASLPLDQSGVEPRQRYLVEQIVHLDRVQATGVAPDVALLHQARSALSRGDRQRLHATLVALDGFALAAGDAGFARHTGPALEALWQGRDVRDPGALAASLERSSGEIFGDDVIDAVQQGYDAAYQRLLREDEHATLSERETFGLALSYLTPGNVSASLSALLSVDGCFDVGGTLSPIRIRETETLLRAVSFPTQELMLVPAKTAEDVRSAVIEDPRSVLLSLAAGRLLSRKFVRYEQRHRHRIQMVGEARIYVLDGSTSMLSDGSDGARARMRDAILMAELATLLRRFQEPSRHTRVVMFYRYFTKRLWEVNRIDTADKALAAIGEVIGSPRSGGTDIEQALISSFELVRRAQGEDPDLARAQIVLITDGHAPVSEQVIREEREKSGALPIGVSVIALGEENPALRELVAHQRARGERVFYHFMDDTTLRELCDGRLGSGPSLHLPGEDGRNSWTEKAQEIESSLGGVLDELAALDRRRHLALLLEDEGEEEAEAYAELGLGPAEPTEGQRALREAAERDRRAVTRRYERWFPLLDGSSTDVSSQPGGHDNAGSARAGPVESQEEAVSMSATGELVSLSYRTEEADVDAVNIVLSTVAEVVSEMGDSSLSRQADAIDILERLLPDAKLSPGRYDNVIETCPDAVAEALTAVHRATVPPAPPPVCSS